MLPENTFVLVEYEIKIKGTDKLVDTTSLDSAKEAGIYDEKTRYGPHLVVIGEKRLLPGLEELIKELDEGQEKEKEIPPEKAFGKRDPSKVKVIPRQHFVRSGIVPEPGKVVEINGQLATIRSITGGRVVVDFNHPLAGKTLIARARIIKIVEEVPEKILYLLLRRLPPSITGDDIKVEYNPEKKLVEISLNNKILDIGDAQIAKRLVVNEIRKYMKEEISKILFVEEISIES